ncbi:xanthine dehydrogenase family protein subunit M [Reyranella sp. CPCC 100927]|uniref:FAD binding domain-containing protein n=1 Tax=Reyranella sp. CPCC 100927 TaxID=2599616 RepID=UPI0011B6D930|nr:xanthine dehydrogenase family protein subunit M [Reyranella sp. CPCC 100927]TWT12923.1 xanthine dehydrogenase family protein subunit M [Reyranella sp. CPCC 100927]
MQHFAYSRVATLADAINAMQQPDAMVIAGGTELLNWMKEGIAAPARLIDVNGIADLAQVTADDRGLRIGALARLSDVAEHPVVRTAYPAIAQALLASASPQIRNMATIGGNLMQRTRCPYFRAEVEVPCNKRRPGSGCAAMSGNDRTAAVLGATAQCIATHPSDLAVALAALDATVHVTGASGPRSIPLVSFYRQPDGTTERETRLDAGELITAIEVPASAVARQSRYLKLRERASYEFALVSVAVGLDVEEGRIRAASIALGGVAPKPWRLCATEDALQRVTLSDEAAVRKTLTADFADATPGRHNGFKVELAKRAVVRALQMAGEGA